MEPELRTTTDWKNYGNKQFVLKRYSDAIRAYTSAISLSNNDTLDPDLVANRAAAYINLEHFSKGLEDAELALKVQPSHAKAIYRKAKALLLLSRAQEAISFLQKEILKYKKGNKELAELLERATQMRGQQLTKEYDVTEHFYSFFTRIENWAEYFGPAEVVPMEGKGRGLVATKNIAEGELIFCLRAFAIEFHDPEKSTEGLDDSIVKHPAVSALHDKGGAWLVQRVYQRIKDEPELGNQVYQLYAGVGKGSLDPSKDDCSILDIERISGIVRYNCFANSDDNEDVEKSSGLWILPSFLNHRCIANNCTWRIFGNFLMIRAYKAIRKGEELLISYASPTWTFKVRQGLLTDRLGFVCHCELCVLDKQLAPEVISVREKLQKLALKQEVDFVGLNPEEDPGQILKKFQESSTILLGVIKRLEDMHPKHGILNVLLVDPLQQLGMKYFGVGDFEKAADCMERAHSIMKAMGLPHGAVEASLWVVGSQLQMGDTKKAKYWIQILKKNAMLAHGTLKTLKMMGEWVLNAMEDHNLS